MRRFFGRWAVRFTVLGLLLAVFVVQGWVGTLMGWTVFAYLFWRAFPGIRKDFRRLWRVSSPTIEKGLARF